MNTIATITVDGCDCKGVIIWNVKRQYTVWIPKSSTCRFHVNPRAEAIQHIISIEPEVVDVPVVSFLFTVHATNQNERCLPKKDLQECTASCIYLNLVGLPLHFFLTGYLVTKCRTVPIQC